MRGLGPSTKYSGIEVLAADVNTTHYSVPSTSGGGKAGTLLRRRAALPLTSKTPSLILFPVCVSSHGTGDLSDLLYCQVMPSTQGLNWEGDEDNPLGLTGLEGLPALVGKGLLQGEAGSLSRLHHPGCQQGADYRHI